MKARDRFTTCFGGKAREDDCEGIDLHTQRLLGNAESKAVQSPVQCESRSPKKKVTGIILPDVPSCRGNHCKLPMERKKHQGI